MPVIDLKFLGPGEEAWPDLKSRVADIYPVQPDLQITGLKGGMTSGKSSLMLRIDLPEGRVIMAETSVAAFLQAADAIRAWDSDPTHPAACQCPQCRSQDKAGGR